MVNVHIESDLIGALDLSTKTIIMMQDTFKKYGIFKCSLDTIMTSNWLIRNAPIYIDFPTPLKNELIERLNYVKYFIADKITPNLSRIPGITLPLQRKLEAAEITTDWMLLSCTYNDITNILDDKDDVMVLTNILLNNDLTWREHRIFVCGNSGEKAISKYSDIKAYCDRCNKRFRDMVDINGFRLYITDDSVYLINLTDELLKIDIEDFYIRYDNKDHDMSGSIVEPRLTVLPNTERTIISLEGITFSEYKESGAFAVIQIDDVYYKFSSDGSRWMYETYFD